MKEEGREGRGGSKKGLEIEGKGVIMKGGGEDGRKMR